MQTTTYKLNVTPGGVPLTIHISQYDVGLRQYTFQPYTNVGEFTYVSGATVTLEATKPDGYAVIHECTYNQDGSITYTIQEQLAAKPGRVWSKVVIRNGDDILGTGAIVWMVDSAGVKDNAIISDSDISALQQWIDDVQDYAEQADGSAQSASSSAFLAESAATQAAGYVDQAVILGGTPLVAATVSAMSDHDRVYVYTGSETGYTAGNWYYWNGSAWTSGGIYNSSAVQTDPTLSISGMAADAAATGELKSDLNTISENTYNLLDVNVMQKGNVTVTNGVASGTASAFTSAFSSGIPTGITYGESTQYTISGKAKNIGSATSGNGLSIRAAYSDGTFSYVFFPNSWATYNSFVLTTTSGKTVTKIYFDYSSQGGNVWEVAELMIEQGDTKHDYVPNITAIDFTARDKADKLNSAVTALDGMVTELDGMLDDVTEKTVNLLDANLLVTTGITKDGDIVSGTATAFNNAYSTGNAFGITFKASTQYTVSAKIKNTNVDATSGNGLRVIIFYTDDTNSMFNISNTTTAYQLMKFTSTASKTVSKVGFSFGSGSGNVWYLNGVQIEEGTTNTPFVHPLTATDDIARNGVASATEQIGLFGVFENLVWEYGSISTSTGLNSTDSQNFRTSKIIHVNKGSYFKKIQTGIMLTAYYYGNNDLAQFTSYEQIIPINSLGYTFTEDCFVRFVIQNPDSLGHSIEWANSAFEYRIVDADLSNKITGAEILVLGTSSYLGNAIVIKFPNGKIMGIDCFIAAAQTFINNSYVTNGVLHFDYFMITHYHKDHVGNIPFLIEHGFIDEDTTMYLPPDLITSYDTNIFFDWLDEDGPKAMYESIYPQIVASGCTIVKPTEGQQVNIAGIDLKFFNCDHSVYYPGGAYATQNYNNLSLCCYLTCEDYNFCDPGDLGYEGMERMVALNTLVKANVYNADHHGWENGTAATYYGLLPAYINRVSPDMVFSEDYSAHNTHIMTPQAELQSWCEATGVPNYRTAINGNMKFQMNRYGIKLLGGYTRFIRNDKNWSYSDNSEHIET